MKCDLNRININLVTQQMGWLGGKGFEFHLWSPRDQTSQNSFVVVNIKILAEYFVPR